MKPPLFFFLYLLAACDPGSRGDPEGSTDDTLHGAGAGPDAAAGAAGRAAGAGEQGPRAAAAPQDLDVRGIPLSQRARVSPNVELGGLTCAVRLTGGAPDDVPLPLVVAVHGLGDKPENFASLFQDFPTRARILLPAGPDQTPNGGWRWFPFSPGGRESPAYAQEVKRAAEQVGRLLEEAPALFDITGEPVITGFSQGGAISYAVAALFPDRIAAALPVGGALPPLLWPEEGARIAPVHAFHGEADRVIAFAAAEATVEAFRAARGAVTLDSYATLGHGFSPELKARWEERIAALLDGAAQATTTAE